MSFYLRVFVFILASSLSLDLADIMEGDFLMLKYLF